RRFVNAGAAANRLISQSAATLSSIATWVTKLNATQSATWAGTTANICQNLPRNAGNVARRHCGDGPDRVDQDRQGLHLRDAARSTASRPRAALRRARRAVDARRRGGGAGGPAGGARRPAGLV